MNPYIAELKRRLTESPPSFGDGDSILTMLYESYCDSNRMDDDQIKTDFRELYQAMNEMPLRDMDAYAESHEYDPQEIGDGFKELEEYLCVLPLDNNNAVFNLCCRLCSAYERKSFLDGLQYGAELILELGKEAAR